MPAPGQAARAVEYVRIGTGWMCDGQRMLCPGWIALRLANGERPLRRVQCEPQMIVDEETQAKEALFGEGGIDQARYIAVEVFPHANVATGYVRVDCSTDAGDLEGPEIWKTQLTGHLRVEREFECTGVEHDILHALAVDNRVEVECVVADAAMIQGNEVFHRDASFGEGLCG